MFFLCALLPSQRFPPVSEITLLSFKPNLVDFYFSNHFFILLGRHIHLFFYLRYFDTLIIYYLLTSLGCTFVCAPFYWNHRICRHYFFFSLCVHIELKTIKHKNSIFYPSAPRNSSSYSDCTLSKCWYFLCFLCLY